MTFDGKINSMSELEAYLLAHVAAAPEIVDLIQHLLDLGTQNARSLSREFILQEAEKFELALVPLPARQFVGKRVFAFYKKNLLEWLQQKLGGWQPAQATVESTLSLLEFPAPEAQDVTVAVTYPIATPETSPASHADPVLEATDLTESSPNADLNLDADSQSLMEDLEAGAQTFITTSAALPSEIEEEAQTFIASAEAPEQQPEWEAELLVYQTQLQVKLQQQYQILQQEEVPEIDLHHYDHIIAPNLDKFSPPHFAKMLRGIMDRYLDTTQEKYPLMRIKDYSLKYEKLLTAVPSLLVIINYGVDLEAELLEKFSRISTLADLNQVIHEYLHYNLQQALIAHGQNFRSQIENCRSQFDLHKLMAQYPLYQKTLVKKYPELQIIGSLEKICQECTPEMKDITRLLNRHLGPGEANTRRFLQNILVKSESQRKIREDLRPVADINTLFKHINELKKQPEMQQTAETLFQMMVTFLRGRQIVPFQTFQTSINFLSPELQRQVLRVVKRKLRHDLERNVQAVVAAKSPPTTRWKLLLDILQNPQFAGCDLQLFTYPLEQLYQKLQAVARHDDPCKAIVRTFRQGAIPDWLRELIISRHTDEKHAGEKSVENCYRDLLALQQSFQSGAVMWLNHPLADLFKSYGQINLATPGTPAVTGYELAWSISRFYSPPSTPLSLPENLLAPLAALIREMITQEQQRRQKKSGRIVKSKEP